MQLTRLAPAGPPDATRRRWTVAASLLLHLVAFAAVIWVAARPRLPDPQAPSYDLVFEPAPASEPQGQGQPPAAAQVPAPEEALPGPPAPPPASPPVPDGVASAVPEAAISAPAPTPAPPAPPPLPQPAPPPQPTTAAAPAAPPAPPTPATAAAPQLAFAQPPSPAEVAPGPAPTEPLPSREPPTVRLETPQEPQAQAQAAPIMPQPPPPLPPLPRAPPRPQIQPRAAPGTFGAPMDLSFGSAPPRPEARGSRSRAIDLSLGPPHEGLNHSDPYAEVRAANASADWNRGLLAYWLNHRYYPRQALEAGEDGQVTVELTVARSGHVELVTLVSRSGSQWLDMAAVSTWRDAKLPPFTPEMQQDHITFKIPINYILLRN